MQTFVHLDAMLEDAETHAARIVSALQADGVLGAMQLEERAVGNPFLEEVKWVRDKPVWPPGPRVFAAVEITVLEERKNTLLIDWDGKRTEVMDFRRRDPCHLDVETRWELRCADGAAFYCPHCGGEHPAPWDGADGTSVVEAIEAAREGGPPELRCPLCRKVVSLRDLRGEPPIAFGALAFTFLNWPRLRPRTIAAMQEAAGGRLAFVET